MPMPALVFVLCLPGRRQATLPRSSIGLRRLAQPDRNDDGLADRERPAGREEEPALAEGQPGSAPRKAGSRRQNVL